MNRKTSQKIAAVLLFLFGAFELMGLLMLIVPDEYLPSDFAVQSLFWGLLSGVYGLSRLLAGYAVWENKKWGFVFGLLLCLTTMIVAPAIVPFGVVDLILALLITLCLLHAYYGDEKMLQG
jgi:hypothetical protein